MPKKILIIKTGYTETLTNEPFKEGDVSLGDVLRTTALLHIYKNDYVTWLTDTQAVPLLHNNPYITNILEWSLTGILQVQNEVFDTVINLEKNQGICALANRIQCRQRYGFAFDPVDGSVTAYDRAAQALYVALDERVKEANQANWLDHLYEMVGRDYQGEQYVIDMPGKPVDGQLCMVGLNWHAGAKFAEKAWPMASWRELQLLLNTESITNSLQPPPHTLDKYIQWLNRVSLIVTNDSLGLHLAMALKKRVVGIFGPTPAKEVQGAKNVILIQGTKMEDTTPERVLEAVKELLNWGMC